jgi:hypothetical protein
MKISGGLPRVLAMGACGPEVVYRKWLRTSVYVAVLTEVRCRELSGG